MPVIYPLKTPSLEALKRLFLLLIYVLLTSCSPEAPDQNRAQKIAGMNSGVTNTTTLSPELSTIFNETCAQCHLKDTTGAPKKGNTSAWNQILSKGMEATLERVINGYGGMPPAGQCFECTPEQLTELIRYMSL